MEISDRLRRARREAGVTQVELARRTGISQSVISAYESGARRPSASSCRRILTSLGIRPSILLDRHRDLLQATLAARGITGARVFGSTARGEDDEGSDLDLIVRFPPGTTLFDVVDIEDALEEVIGLDVDLVSERGLDPAKPAHRAILDDAIPV